MKKKNINLLEIQNFIYIFLLQIVNSSIRSFSATLGPAGGKRGYSGITGHVSNGLAWYINGLLIPELWLRRGLTYSFKVISSSHGNIHRKIL